MISAPIVAVEGMRIDRGGQRVVDITAWSLPAGEHAVLLGPSGSGKTTLLHCLGGLTRLDAGAVWIAGTDITTLGEATLDRFRGARIGIVFQTLRLIRALSVAQNLALALHLAGRRPDRARIKATLARLGIAHLADARPYRLSVGEQQRAAIARAIIAGPALILADEPTSALDDSNAAAAIALLQQEARSVGAGLVVATHDHRIAGAFTHRLDLAAPQERSPCP
jgi:putative ABC transport system ATP-binding protein